MKNPVYEQIQARKVKARLRMLLPTKKSVPIEAVEFMRLRCVGCQSHVYSFRLSAFPRTSLRPNPGSLAS
jgi:hypothetical protein